MTDDRRRPDGADFYRMLAETSSDMIFVVDRDLNHEYVNSAAAAAFGLGAEEIIGRNWLEFFPEEENPHLLANIKRVFENGEPQTVEIEVFVPQLDRSVWLSISMTPLKDDVGAVRAVMGVARDISRAKEAELALKKSEAIYRTLAETAQDFIFIVDCDGVIEYVNEHGARMFGTTVGAIEGLKITDIFPADIAQHQLASVRSVIQADMPMYFEEYTVMPMGDLWLGTSLSPIKDSEGKNRAALGISRNITAKKRIEEELRAEKDFSDNAINSLPGIFYLFDKDGNFVRWNKNFEKVTGYSAEEMKKMKPQDFFRGADKEEISARIRQVYLNGKADAEADLVGRDGVPTRYYFTGYRFESEGEPYLVGLGIDISVLRKTELELGESDERLKLALEGTGDSIWDWDVVSGAIVFDEHWQRHLGYQPGEHKFDFEWWDAHVHPDSKPVFEKALKDYLEGRKPAYEIEYRMKNREGEWIWIWAIGKCVEWDREQKPLRFIGTHRDISIRKQLEDQLGAERDRAQRYLDIAPAMIVMLDDRGTVQLINAKGCEILECEASEALGKNWFGTFLPIDIRSDVKSVFVRLVDGDMEPVEYYENPVLTATGKQKLIAWHNQVLYDDEGNIRGILCSGEDITERKKAEEQLRESEQRFKTMFDTAVAGILLADIGTRRFALANDTICDMLGYSMEELRRMGVEDIHPPEALEFVFDQFERQARGEFHISRNLPVKRKDGSIIHADVSSAPVTISGVQYLMGYFSDVTDRLIAEKALVASEQRYRSIFEESNDVIFISTSEGRLADINPAGVKLFGYESLEEMLEIDIGEALFRDPETWRQYQEAIERDGQVKDYELRLLRKDGAELIVSVTAKTVVDDEGAVTAYRGIMRDITEQRQLESQLLQAQKMESIGNLAGGVAHDFNNYLTAIQGYADLALLESPEGGPLHEYLNEIRSSSGRASDLTRQLLLFGRREDVDLKPVDIPGTINDLQKMLSRLIGERHTIVTRLTGNLAPIMADKGLVEQMLVNLVVNARDAMPDGGEIAIAATGIELKAQPMMEASGLRPGEYIRISVADKGYGIDELTQKHIFEPFFTTKDVGKGTGLGLSVAYGIVAQHQGMIDVESEPGAGATFNVYIPVISEQEMTYCADESGDRIRHGDGAKLLLVEDDDAVRNLAAKMLTENGYKVLAADSVEEAEKVFVEHDADFDIIFSDVILPDGNGMNLAERLLRQKPDLGVVLASGYTGVDIDRSRIEKRGFSYIQKPYTLARLVEAVGELVKR